MIKSQLPVAQYLFVPISEVDFALQEGEAKSLEWSVVTKLSVKAEILVGGMF